MDHALDVAIIGVGRLLIGAILLGAALLIGVRGFVCFGNGDARAFNLFALCGVVFWISCWIITGG